MDINCIAVIGAGALGRGIAREAALAGYRTILEDVMPEKLAAALDWIESSLDAEFARGVVTSQAADEALARVSTVRTVEDACHEADLLIDALPEELELKLELFTLFDKFARPQAVMASTSPRHSIADMAAMTYRPELCVGLRFLDSATGKKLLEIVRAPQTSGETVATCAEAARRMGREASVLRESPEDISGGEKA
ncbi:MAG: hypothetical protein LAN71_15710 [Acidobacteriia bacterium]|nr:hypothetical protein [Terriglobia bacterium]